MSTYTREQIRVAILKAADTITADASKFKYSETAIHECGTPMCAAGWIGFYLGIKPKTYVNQVCEIMLNDDSPIAYTHWELKMGELGYHWFVSAERAAHTLRAYADRYFPAPAAEQPPHFNAAYLAFRSTLLREAVTEVQP